jgi:hypothetical protein
MTGSVAAGAWCPRAGAGPTSRVVAAATPRGAMWPARPLHIARTTRANAHFIDENASRSPRCARRVGC